MKLNFHIMRYKQIRIYEQSDPWPSPTRPRLIQPEELYFKGH
jgi:hypothetical protein